MLKAIATAPGHLDSGIAQAEYTIDTSWQAAKPVISPTPSGTYYSCEPLEVTLSTTEPNGVIYYTLSGGSPTGPSGLVYTGPLHLGGTTWVQAVTKAAGKADSEVATALYQWALLEWASPVTLTPGTTTTSNDVSVTLASITPGSTVCYTLDGSVPRCVQAKDACDNGETFPHGAPPVIIDRTGTVLTALACLAGMCDSALTSAVYTLNTAPVVFDPPAGQVASGTSIAITTETIGATIWYRTDGIDPTCTTGEMYAGAVVVTQDTEFRAVSCKANYGPTPLVPQSAAYVVTGM